MHWSRDHASPRTPPVCAAVGGLAAAFPLAPELQQGRTRAHRHGFQKLSGFRQIVPTEKKTVPSMLNSCFSSCNKQLIRGEREGTKVRSG